MYSLTKKCIAECLGTFVLVFFAVGTAVVTGNLVATALSFGLVIVAMAYTIGNISGCHINPAVSIAMLTLGKMKTKDFIGYIIAQFTGAIIGALALYSIIRMGGIVIPDLGYGENLFIGGGTYSFGAILGSFLLETILTFVFVYVICNVVSNGTTGKLGGLIIGLTLTLVHLIGIRLTGTSVNPARSFAPAVVSLFFGNSFNGLAQLWVFIVAPMGGGVIAALVYKLLHEVDSPEKIAEYQAEKEALKIQGEQEKKENAEKKARLDEEKRLKDIEKKSAKMSDSDKKGSKKNKITDLEEDEDNDEELEREDS